MVYEEDEEIVEYEEEEIYEDYEEEIPFYFDEYFLETFVEEYRSYYEMALADEDFFYVSDMLLYDSSIYHGIADYINEISGQGMIFEFIDQIVLGVEIYEDYALVHTYESFDFMNAAGEGTLEERNKTYTIVIDEYGGYQISDIVDN